ncbi:MAG: porin [Burkholderiales bacterium]|nr:porin [Burkholderiales bacterium]
MKKSLIALSVLAAFAGAAHAQSSVTVYGVVDMALQNENNGGAKGSVTALDAGEQSGSRLGFKGSEDLGGGLKAIFDLEMGILADSGASQGGLTFGRQSWLGLAGDFGTVKMGRQYTPQFYFFDSVDPFDLGMTSGHAGASTSTGGVFGFLSASAWRVNNSISYQSKDMSGFSAMGLYGFGEVAGNTSASRSAGFSAQYAAGPVYVGGVYYKQNDAAGNGTKSVLVGGTYDFGVAKAAAGYSKDTSDNNSVDQKGFMLGVTVPVSPADAFLATAARLTNNLPADGNKSTQLAVGFTHSMSKRTNIYTSFSRVTNDANVNGGGLAAGNGLTDRLFNVGIRHMF